MQGKTNKRKNAISKNYKSWNFEGECYMKEDNITQNYAFFKRVATENLLISRADFSSLSNNTASNFIQDFGYFILDSNIHKISAIFHKVVMT